MNVYRGATAVEVIAIRLDPGDDIVDCLPRVARDLQLAAGAVISGAGTLSRFALESPATETFPPAVNVTEKQGPGQIVAAQGISMLNRVWQSPETLPSAAELRRPEAWVERIGGLSAAA